MVFIVYLTVVCFFQAKDIETCLLSDPQQSNNEPLILFIIDINTPRLVLYRLSVKLSFTVVRQAFNTEFFLLCSVNVKVFGQPDNILISKQKPEAPKGKIFSSSFTYVDKCEHLLTVWLFIVGERKTREAPASEKIKQSDSGGKNASQQGGEKEEKPQAQVEKVPPAVEAKKTEETEFNVRNVCLFMWWIDGSTI